MLPAGLGENGGAGAVDPQRGVLLGLRVVDRGPGGAVHHDGGAVLPEGLAYRLRVGDVQCRPVRGDRGDVLTGEPGQDVLAQHPGGSGDQPDGAHRAARSFSGSHQARLSRYHCTVSARPVRKSLRGS